MGAKVRFMNEEYFPRLGKSLPSFEASSGISVDLDLLSVDPFWNDARTGFGDPPTWDLLAPDEVIVIEQMRRGLVEPLEGRIERDGFDVQDFLAAGVDCFRQDGHLYAIPYVTMSNVLIYRRDILDRYGFSVPKTWDELRSASLGVQLALRAGGTEGVYGFTSRGLAGYGHNFWIIGATVFPSWGWNWDRGEGEPPLVYQQETVDALAFYAALLQEAGPPESATMTFTDTHRAFADGRAVFLLDSATELTTMRHDPTDIVGKVSSAAVVPIGPVGVPEPGLYAPALCIPRSGAEKDAAWEVLKFAASFEEMLQDAIEGGFCEPSRQSVFASTEYRSTIDEQLHEVLAETRRLAKVNRPLIPSGFELGDIVGEAVQSAVGGGSSADEALRTAQKTIDGMEWGR